MDGWMDGCVCVYMYVYIQELRGYKVYIGARLPLFGHLYLFKVQACSHSKSKIVS